MVLEAAEAVVRTATKADMVLVTVEWVSATELVPVLVLEWAVLEKLAAVVVVVVVEVDVDVVVGGGVCMVVVVVVVYVAEALAEAVLAELAEVLAVLVVVLEVVLVVAATVERVYSVERVAAKSLRHRQAMTSMDKIAMESVKAVNVGIVNQNGGLERHVFVVVRVESVEDNARCIFHET